MASRRTGGDGPQLERPSPHEPADGPGAGGQPGGWRRAELLLSARAGPGRRADFAPRPSVAAAGCDHRATTQIDLAAGAPLHWREEIVLGRHEEPSGRCISRLDVSLAGTPAYRGGLTAGCLQTGKQQ